MKKVVASLMLMALLVGVSSMAFAQATILYVGSVVMTGYNASGTPIVQTNITSANGAAVTVNATFSLAGTNANGMLATCLSALAAGKQIQFRATSTANLTPISSLLMTNTPAP